MSAIFDNAKRESTQIYFLEEKPSSSLEQCPKFASTGQKGHRKPVPKCAENPGHVPKCIGSGNLCRPLTKHAGIKQSDDGQECSQ
ncbi:hypothetical protein pipiens_007422 [Culex pipiens pipiens]|uniref:Uncharacterized protein n=1 Tax=Culex pipiens pipiens TaxID=38569 RepID=A0ABD1DL23_CULPP